MHKRGMSAIIATVLIIGLTVVIAAAIIIWGIGFSSDIQEGADDKNDQTMFCANSKIKLRNGCLENNQLKLLIENQGQVALTGFNVRVIGSASAYGSKIEKDLGIAGITQILVDHDDTIGTIKSVEVLPMLKVKEMISCAQSDELYSIKPC
ncbi:MAG: hypothetical protein KKA65_02270 [Nanoarchaeota archaeon]|nr:hypothetical protein [Nanoarchaeota archaeon]MBU4242018.1 hypothetical protein [Nanoarchaeota archaeon]MBU4351472.1 hypothetical protein [Nanoarchaeota archaeon]MBU4456302.1 hypothetical protein [Nanoarchaeota archaeon]MCG2719715.1 hypothetical protein [Nanoarchaeota archaeon]